MSYNARVLPCMNATLNALFCAAPNLLTVCNVLYMVLEPQNKGTTRLESKRCRRNREHALQIKGGLFAALLPVTHSAICVLPCVCRCYYRLASAWQKTANPSLQYIFLVTTPYTLTIAIQRPKCRKRLVCTANPLLTTATTPVTTTGQIGNMSL